MSDLSRREFLGAAAAGGALLAGQAALGAPAADSLPKVPPAKSYKVKDGDTLYQIALRHGTTVAEILAINGLGGPGLIKPGDKLKIPATK